MRLKNFLRKRYLSQDLYLKCVLYFYNEFQNIPSNASWDQTVKIISRDPLYPQVKKLNEKRQLFNAYKTQKQKDEKDEHRLKAKKAKEDLEKFLMKNEDITSKTKYYRLEEKFEHLDVSKLC